MKKSIYLLLAAMFIFGTTSPVHAESDATVHILITEIQTGGASDATEEFVELYNPGDAGVDVTGWLLQYRAASGTPTQSWATSTTKATVACPDGSPPDCRVLVAPHQRAVLVHTIANIAGALAMSGGFAGAGGQIRLVQPGATQVVHDFVGYGTAADSEGAPAAAPAGGHSIKRMLDPEGEPIDTNNNAADFTASCGDPTPGRADTAQIPYATGCVAPPTQTPQSTDPTTPPEDTAPPETPADPPTETDEPGKGAAPIYLPILITEVLPDPASPQSDSADEFIELYNPNDTAVTLADYRLQTGADYRYSYTLGDTPLAPHAYVAIPSAVSKLSLANSGSGVRLIDPAGQTAAEAPNYGDAKEGQSWMQDDTGWHWTLTPTPNAANVLTLPVPKITATSAAPKKAATVTKTTIPKVAAPKTPAIKAPAAKKAATPANTAGAAPSPQNPAIQYWLLAPLGVLAIGYVVYEYRQNIARGWRKITGAAAGKKASALDED